MIERADIIAALKKILATDPELVFARRKGIIVSAKGNGTVIRIAFRRVEGKIRVERWNTQSCNSEVAPLPADLLAAVEKAIDR